ncbi:hypothetical protein [Caballeronia sp. KNU42]
MKRFNSWSEAEDAALIEIWKSAGSLAKYLHLLPGRSRNAIEKRAGSIGLGHRIAWTPEQDALLRDIWVNGGPIKLHAHQFPSHTVGAIVGHAYLMGLGKRPNRRRGIESVCWKLMRQELKNADRACIELAELVNLNRSGVSKHMAARHEAKEVHICKWKRLKASGKHVPVYRLGAGVDAPKPPPMSNAIKNRKYRDARRVRDLLLGEPVDYNPFAIAAGAITAPSAATGRIYRQSMSMKDDEVMA